MNWLFADYVMLSVAGICGIIGLFIGFSGALAFMVAAVASALSGKYGWILIEEYCTTWMCTLFTVVNILLTFGLVRWIVKKSVGGLLKQPADAIFGSILSAVTGLGVAGIIAYTLNYFKIVEIQSVLLSGAVNAS